MPGRSGPERLRVLLHTTGDLIQMMRRPSGPARPKLEVNALLRLEMRQYTEEVFRGRVAIRPEHAHQAVGGQGSRLRKLPETDCGVDAAAHVLRRIARPVFSSPESMISIASQSNALRNFGSCCARSRIVSRKSLVSAIVWFLSIPLLVVIPVRNRLRMCRPVPILLSRFEAFCAAGQPGCRIGGKPLAPPFSVVLNVVR